jgi:hypothetical protein
MGSVTAAILVAISVCLAAEFWGNLGWFLACLLGVGGYACARYADFLTRRRRFNKNATARNRAWISSRGAHQNGPVQDQKGAAVSLDARRGQGQIRLVAELNRATIGSDDACG